MRLLLIIFIILVNSHLIHAMGNKGRLSSWRNLLNEKFPMGRWSIPYYLIEPLDQIVETEIKGNVRLYNLKINNKNINLPAVSLKVSGIDRERQVYVGKKKLVKPIRFHIDYVQSEKVKSAYLYLLKKQSVLAKFNLKSEYGIRPQVKWTGRYRGKLILKPGEYYELRVEVVFWNHVKVKSQKKYFSVLDKKYRNKRVKTSTMKAKEFFASAKMRGQLKEVSLILKQYKDLNILLIGYSDRSNSALTNEKAALKKAKSIRSYVMKVTKLPAKRFRTYGFDSRYLILKSKKKNSVDMLLTEDIHRQLKKLIRRHKWKLLMNRAFIPIAESGKVHQIQVGQFERFHLQLIDEFGDEYSINVPWSHFQIYERPRSIRPVKDFVFGKEPEEFLFDYSFGITAENTRVIMMGKKSQSPIVERIDHPLSLKKSFLQFDLISNYTGSPLRVNKAYKLTRIKTASDRLITPNFIELTMGFSPIFHKKNYADPLLKPFMPTMLFGTQIMFYQNFGFHIEALGSLVSGSFPYPGKKELPKDIKQRAAVEEAYEYNAYLLYRYFFNSISNNSFVSFKLGYHQRELPINNSYDTLFINKYRGFVFSLRGKTYFEAERGIELEARYTPMIEANLVNEVESSKPEQFKYLYIGAGFFFSWLAFDSKIEYFYSTYYSHWDIEVVKDAVAFESYYGIRWVSELNVF